LGEKQRRAECEQANETNDTEISCVRLHDFSPVATTNNSDAISDVALNVADYPENLAISASFVPSTC
jgi:hypothetical protein